MRKWLAVPAVVALSFGPVAFGGVKPITNIPDYDGTYWGAPGTGGDCDSASQNCDSTAGRKMFTTLYRDNYNRTSGCAGERCGKHPGVDIAIVSATPVKAALGGIVIEAACDWNNIRGANNGALGFGGLVIIESDNPYMPGNKVYVAYAHLDNWSVYSVGQAVTQGQTIGYSGGDDVTGICPGASDGAHLHFQVDKNYPQLDSFGNLAPWFPTGQVEQADTSFTVPIYTHNPLPFVLGYAYNWNFFENNNKELWGAANVNGYNTLNSDLWIDSESVNPYVGRSSFFGDVACGETAACSREITLNADIFKKIMLDLNFRCFTNPVTVWYRGPDDVWHGGSFNYDTARKYYINMGSLPYWNGIISDIMVEPSQGCMANPGPEEYFIKWMYFYSW